MMLTAEKRYASALADVRRGIAAVESQAIGYKVDEVTGQVEWFAGRSVTAIERGQVLRLNGQWLRATTPIQREAVARKAETLAARSRGPGSCTRDAGLVDVQTPGSIRAEMETVEVIVL